MSKLLPHLRHDSAKGVPPALRDYLDKNYFASLANIEKHNPKLLIVFSGGNALGKTTLAYAIRDQLGALVLENDDIKAHILQYDPAISRDKANQLTWQYSMDLYGRLDSLTPNGRIVRDGVIDWYFDRILPVFERQGYPLFIIGFDVSDARKKELVLKRGDKPTVSAQDLVALIPEHKIHIKRFREAHKPTLILDDKKLFDTEYVIHSLKSRIQS